MINKKKFLKNYIKDANKAHNANKKKLSRELFSKHFCIFEDKKVGKELCDYLIENKLNSSEFIIKKKTYELSELTNGKIDKDFYNLIINYLKIFENKGHNYWPELDFNFKCIFFGGIGFSGSSAIFDYYNTYTNLPGTRTQHFLVKRVINIVLKSNDYVEVFNNFLIFLFRDLMGLYNYSSPYSYRLVVYGQQVFTHNSFAKFNEVFKNITFYIFSKNFFKDDVCKKIDILINLIFNFLKKENESTFLAFGFIDVPSYHLIKYLRSHKFIFSLRDPRDIYLDARSRNLNFYDNINIFIKQYSKKYELYNTIKKNKDSNVKAIYFENFVFDKSLRNKVSDFLGIKINENSIKKKIKYSFNFDESKKNINLYNNNFSEIKNIQEIEKKLSSFLFNTK